MDVIKQIEQEHMRMDIPRFNTGDTVTVTFQNTGIKGQSSKTLQAGTTSVNLNGEVNQPPSIQNVPDQNGTEDVPWVLDLDQFITDPDTPKHTLTIRVSSSYVSVTDHTLTFLYPEGITADSVTITVSDSSSSDMLVIDVTIEPVNDPPVMSEIPLVSLIEGSGTSVDLSLYVSDPDDPDESMTLEVLDPGNVNVSTQGLSLEIYAPTGAFGLTTIGIRVQDPDELSDDGSIEVEVGANITALMEFYGNQIDDLYDQIGDLYDENSNLSSQVANLNSEILRLEGDNSDLQDELDELESTAGSLLDELDGLRAQSRQQGETISSLEAEKAELESILADIEDDSDAIIAFYLSTISNLNATSLEYLDKISSLEAIIADLEANITALEESNAEDEELIIDLMEEKEDLQEVLDSKELELSELEALSGNLQTKVDDLEAQKNQVEETLDEIEIVLQKIQAENTNLQSRLDSLTLITPATIIEATNRSQGNNTLTKV